MVATFVLVHGAWLGGWVWRYVASPLRALGHEVYTPTLTGLGERVHLASPAVGLETHIQDIVNLLEYEDLGEVILVGHSYAGMVITGVADRMGHRIRHLVYLDAFVPLNSESLHDLVPSAGGQWNRELARRDGDGWRIPLEAEWRRAPDERVLQWMNPRWTDMPLACFEQPLHLRQSARPDVCRTYILCTRNDRTDDIFIAVLARIKADPSWRLLELPADHTAMVSAPHDLVNLLQEIAHQG